MKEEIYEIPIGLMDADIFGRLKLGENEGWRYILWKMGLAEKNGAKYFTILFHQESYKMRGGRLYRRLLEYISERGIETEICIEVINNLRESINS